ncbi:MAG: hypothetical protein HS116_00430 [Planctomycetes bacterium]|nr:hypothetical protein [Planctomycetota bacterium]
MRPPMNPDEYDRFEALARTYCELRAEYRRRKDDNSLGHELEQHMVQTLSAIDLKIQRMKSADELERLRAYQSAAFFTTPQFETAGVRTRSVVR